MNRSFLLTVLITLLSISAYAQMQRRMVLIEEFSNTGCGPCANYSPVLDSVVSYRLGDVISIKYHGNHPDKNDIFYLNQQVDMDKRLNFYNITAYPTTVINGKECGYGMADVALHNAINEQLNTESSFDIKLEASVANNELSVKATATTTEKVTNENLRLFVCAIEEYYENAAVFHNGETHVRNIMRKMLTGGDGYTLGSTMEANTPYIYETKWTIEQFGSESQLGVVAFLQDISTKQVVATAYVPREYNGENQVALMNLEGTPDNLCLPNYYGNVTFRNIGKNDITSVTLNVMVNGTTKQYAWTGSIGTLQKANMQFDSFTDFSLNSSGTTNDVEVWLSDINGQDIETNHITTNFSNAITVKESVQLRIYTDKKPEEISWQLLNSAGDVIDQGGNYTEQRHVYNHTLQIDKDDCYTLAFSDTGKDGIAGDFGNGYYQLYQVTADGKKTNVAQGYYEGEYFDLFFSMQQANGTLGINANITDNDAYATAYDINGNIIAQGLASTIGSTLAGYADKGIYIIRGGDGTVRKVIIE